MSIAPTLAVALAATGLILLWLALHPFTTYPLSLWVWARFRPRPIAVGAVSGRTALCVCAYNEETVIEAKITNILKTGEAVGGVEACIYVDGNTDGTADIVRGFGDQVRLLASPVRTGKTAGMNRLVATTTADYVVFSDANVLFAPDALPKLLAPFADPEVGCVCGHLIYMRQEGSATASTGSLYWRLEESIKRLESLTGSVMGADGSIFALRRSLHEPPPPDLIDDMYISLAVLSQGYRIVRAADALAFEEAVSNPGEEMRRKVRIACQAFNVHRAMWPRLRRMKTPDLYKYVSHKLLRWLTVYLFVASLPCLAGALAVAGAFWSLGVLASLGIVGLAAVMLARSGPLAALRDMGGAFVATGIGVARSWKGDRFQTWSPPQSARTMARLPVPSSRV